MVNQSLIVIAVAAFFRVFYYTYDPYSLNGKVSPFVDSILFNIPAVLWLFVDILVMIYWVNFVNDSGTKKFQSLKAILIVCMVAFPVTIIALGIWQNLDFGVASRMTFNLAHAAMLIAVGLLAFFYGRRLHYLGSDLEKQSSTANLVLRLTRSLYVLHIQLWIIVGTLVVSAVIGVDDPIPTLVLIFIIRMEEFAAVMNFILLVSGRTLQCYQSDSDSSSSGMTVSEIQLDMKTQISGEISEEQSEDFGEASGSGN